MTAAEIRALADLVMNTPGRFDHVERNLARAILAYLPVVEATAAWVDARRDWFDARPIKATEQPLYAAIDALRAGGDS